MARAEFVGDMRDQMALHLDYMRICQGWSKAERAELVADYKREMETPAGFAAIDAHLASVTPLEAQAIANHYRRRT